MRFLLVPHTPQTYDHRMLDGLAEALRSAGHEAKRLDSPTRSPPHDFDVILQVNVGRPDNLPERVRHIAWIQDVTESDLRTGLPGDLTYFISDPEWLGSDTPGAILSTGVRPDFQEPAPEAEKTIDFSICGFITSRLEPRDNEKDLFVSVARDFTPLSGAFNHRKYNNSGVALNFARRLDRETLGDAALRVSSNTEFWGPGWGYFSKFKAHARGLLRNAQELTDLYRRTRINLHSNTQGLGIHSRVLECMAVGGFVMAHTSPNESLPGGIRTAFEPDVHYVEFTPETFAEVSRRWLADPEGRARVGHAAMLRVKESHMWSHRSAQILKDLDRSGISVGSGASPAGPVSIFTFVHGAYLDWFERTVTSLCWPRNLAALQAASAKWRIYTTAGDAQRAGAIAARTGFEVEIVESDATQPPQFFIEQHVRHCVESRVAMMMCPPDTIFGEGSIEMLIALGAMPRACVASPHVRVRAEEFLGAFDAEAKPISNARLVTMAFAMLHKTWADAEFRADTKIINSYVGGVMWRRLGGLYTVQHRLPTCYYANVDQSDLDWLHAEATGDNSWDHAWPGKLVGEMRHRNIAASDACFIVEMTKTADNHPKIEELVVEDPDRFWQDLAHHRINRSVVVVFRPE